MMALRQMTSFILLCLLHCTVAFSSPSRLLILGLGNVGQAVADEANSHFEWIRGTSRGTSSDDGLVVPFSSASSYFAEVSHLLVTIPPNDAMDKVMESLRRNLPRRTWIGVVSTTGVYGNHNGAWVDEESPLLCSDPSSAFRFCCYEQKWVELAKENNWTLAIFRCAGLYGPNRSALHTMWRRGYSPPSQDGVTNRIHESDVARAIVSGMRQSSTGVFNLSDDVPEKRSVVSAYAAKLFQSIHVDLPSATTERTSERSRRRTSEHKLVSNKRMKQELISELMFPSYESGLLSILHNKNCAWWD